MKVRKFNPSTVSSRGKRSVRTVSFNRRNGLVSINQATQADLNITLETKVSFIQDEEKPKDWYLIKDNEGYSLRRSSASGSLIFTCKELSNCILESIDILDNSARIVLSDNPIIEGDQKLYPLVTRLAAGGKRKIETGVKRF